jgi:spermidine/putrescine transport system permease protein
MPIQLSQSHRLIRFLLWTYAFGFYVVLYAPLVIILVLSFNVSESVGLPFHGVTMRWYSEALAMPDFLTAIGNSFAVGTLVAVIATTLAMLLGLAFRRKWRFKSVVFNMVLLPIAVPGIVGGIILLLFFGYLGMRSSLWTTVLVAHVNYVLPFAFLTLFPRLEGLDASIEEAAMDLGATPLVVFTHVVFPIIRTAFIATALFAFSLSFDEFVRTLFVTGGERTVPLLFWAMISNASSPQIPAMGVIILIISASSTAIAFLFMQSAGLPDRRKA